MMSIDNHQRSANHLISSVFAERFNIASEIEQFSFEAGWQAHLFGIDVAIGIAVHQERRSTLGLPVKPLVEAWKLGYAARQAWLTNSLHTLVKSPGARNPELQKKLFAVMVELSEEWKSVPAVVRKMAEQWPEIWMRDVHDELRVMASEGALELKADDGLSMLSTAELFLCPRGPQGIRFVQARHRSRG